MLENAEVQKPREVEHRETLSDKTRWEDQCVKELVALLLHPAGWQSWESGLPQGAQSFFDRASLSDLKLWTADNEHKTKTKRKMMIFATKNLGRQVLHHMASLFAVRCAAVLSSLEQLPACSWTWPRTRPLPAALAPELGADKPRDTMILDACWSFVKVKLRILLRIRGWEGIFFEKWFWIFGSKQTLPAVRCLFVTDIIW